MKTPGITVRPLILMDGGHEVNEVFFDDVKVPVENLVHEEHKGWTVAKYLLGHERMGSGAVGAAKRELAALQALAARTRQERPAAAGGPALSRPLSRTEIELQALEITSMRFLDQMRRSGQPPGADVSMLKIRGTEVQQMITELMMQAAGPQARRSSGRRRGRGRRVHRRAWRRATSTTARPASTPGPTRSSATSSPR
jgi:alkylation response protein AidB-like acyl-CoA dehydrogenase